MQQREIISMMDARRVQGIGDEAGLRALVLKYPYCSTFQVLNAINLKEQDSIDFKSQLNRAAIVIQDRSKLYDYIIKENLLSRIESNSAEAEEEMEPEITVAPVSEPEPIIQPEEAKELKVESVEEIEPEVPEQSVPESADHFKTQALEDQIMHEAILHLGEIENEIRMQELALEEVENPAATPSQEATSEEPLTFGAWLLQKNSPKEKTPPLERQIIDKFIQESPQISPVKTAFFSPSQMGKMSLIEDESFVTETLAKIYERQGDYKKAARAYKNLKLKFPEKSIYFADLEKKAQDLIK